MKKCSKYMLTFLVLLVMSYESIYAQKVMGEKVLTLGVGLSANLYSGDSYSYPYSYPYQKIDFYPTPAVNLMYDYSFADKLSIGLAGSYQNYVYSYTNMIGYDTLGTPLYDDKAIEERYSRMNVGTRVLFHFGRAEVVDFYTGARLGLSIWEKDSKRPREDYSPFYQNNKNDIIFTPQALFGTRIYFTHNLGLNLEVGLGAPYYFMTGLNVKF